MTELSENFRFTFKTRQSFFVVGERGRQHLDRHLSVQLRIRRPIHFTHPALPQLGGNLVVGNGTSSHNLFSSVKVTPAKARETIFNSPDLN